MAVSQTLREIAIDKAKKRPELVDYITEDAPILDQLKWISASHGLWNVEEVLSDITGAQFVDLDAPLPTLDSKTKLQQTYVSVLGGEMVVGEDKAAQFGGAPKYFAKREKHILRKAGMDTEIAIFDNYWRKAAVKQKLYTKAGGSGSALSTIVVCKFDEALNTGIYDPTQFSSGRLIEPKPINGGNLYQINAAGTLGYGVRYKGRFGWQLLEPKECVYAICNIDANHLPTLDMLEDAIDAVKGKPSNTMILGNYKVLRKTLSALKMANIQYSNGDQSIKTFIGDINGIKICGSYNVSDLNETAVA